MLPSFCALQPVIQQQKASTIGTAMMRKRTSSISMPSYNFQQQYYSTKSAFFLQSEENLRKIGDFHKFQKQNRSA